MASGATRGQPSGGEAPDRTNYDLGNDPNWLSNFAQQGQGLNQQAQQIGYMGQQAGQAAAVNAAGLGTGYGGAASSAGARAAPATQYAPGLGQVQASNQQGGSSQYELANSLQQMARAPQGPSAAQAQLQKGTDAALNSQLALARSGSGYGESANALNAAGANSAGIIADQGNNAAILKAQEDQNYRQQQAQLMNFAGQELAAGRQGDLGQAQQLAQQGQFGTSAALQQTGMNDQLQQGLYNDQLQAGQLSLTGEQLAQQSQQNALGFEQQGQGQQLAAAQAQQQGGMGYENDLNNVYQTDMQHNIESRKLDQQRDKDRVSGVASTAGALLGGIAMSDRRAKRKIRDANLDQAFRDLGGDELEVRRPARPRATELSGLYSDLAA